MRPNGGEERAEPEAVETWNGVIRDRREIDVEESGVIVTHTITGTGTGTVKFQLVDPIPAHFDVDGIAFHPDYQPSHGWIGPDDAIISGVVGPDQDVVVKYGFRPTTRPGPDAIQEVQTSSLPSIELSEPTAGDEPVDAELAEAAMRRSGSTADVDDTRSERLFSALDWQLPEDDEPAVRAEATVQAGADASTAGREAARDEGGPSSADAAEAGASDAESGRAAEGAVDGTAADEDVAAGADESETAADSPGASDPAAALIDQLESGDVSADQRARLADGLRDVLAATDDTPASTRVRLERLESEMQAFAAYSAALEAIIDEHGPAEEFLAEVRGDIRSLESELDRLEGELDRAVAERESMADQVDALADETARLDSRLERLQDRFESVRTSHRSRLSELDATVERLGPTAERVDALEAEVASVRAAVEDAEARRNAIVEALTSDDDPG